MSPESIHAMLPPPAPTALISVWGVRFAYGPTNCSLVSGTTSSSMRQTSVLVPPMSQVMRLGRSSRWPRSAAARNEGRGFQGGDVVEDGAVGAGDLEYVPEPGRGQHPDLGTPSLQDRIRADGDAVDEALHFREVDAEAFEHVEDRARRVRRRGGDLRVAKRPGRIVEHRRVRKGSAYVHADAVSSLSIRHVSFVLPGVRFARDARLGLSRRKRTLCWICAWGRTAAREGACGSRFGSDIEPM